MPKPKIKHADLLENNHYRGELETGELFVFCPVGKIVSWHPDDYKNCWCHFCKRYFKELK